MSKIEYMKSLSSYLDRSWQFGVIQQKNSNLFCIFRKPPCIRITGNSILLNISSMSNYHNKLICQGWNFQGWIILTNLVPLSKIKNFIKIKEKLFYVIFKTSRACPSVFLQTWYLKLFMEKLLWHF